MSLFPVEFDTPAFDSRVYAEGELLRLSLGAYSTCTHRCINNSCLIPNDVQYLRARVPERTIRVQINLPDGEIEENPAVLRLSSRRSSPYTSICFCLQLIIQHGSSNVKLCTSEWRSNHILRMYGCIIERRKLGNLS